MDAAAAAAAAAVAAQQPLHCTHLGRAIPFWTQATARVLYSVACCMCIKMSAGGGGCALEWNGWEQVRAGVDAIAAGRGRA